MTSSAPSSATWLKGYYFTRAAVSALWVAAAFTIGKDNPMIAAPLLVAYPAWDAVANGIDATRSGGLGRNLTQTINLVVSVATAIAVFVALGIGQSAVLAVFGAWAILSGLLQLFTGVRRWKTGAQWAMVLSGAQSALAGGFFLKLSSGAPMPAITTVAGYAGVGAVYFLVSAVWLTIKSRTKAQIA